MDASWLLTPRGLATLFFLICGLLVPQVTAHRVILEDINAHVQPGELVRGFLIPEDSRSSHMSFVLFMYVCMCVCLYIYTHAYGYM